MATSLPRTHLTFHHDGAARTLETKVASICPFADLEPESQQLFKQGGSENDYIITTEATIFHPQGGGQPSDVGTIKGAQETLFTVQAVRMDALTGGHALHLGQFSSPDGADKFKPQDQVTQEIDWDKRLLYSRLHTAGHVLGAAVRHLLEKEVDGFDELKASHFPDSAACEFQGLIEGKWKGPIQDKLNEYIAAKMPVEIDWWDEEDFRKNGLERLIPDPSLVSPGEKFRIVNIKGAEIYPCGGTHVETTDLCGETLVKKIARAKGQSRVSYTVKQ